MSEYAELELGAAICPGCKRLVPRLSEWGPLLCERCPFLATQSWLRYIARDYGSDIIWRIDRQIPGFADKYVMALVLEGVS
jgi:hypothetical protein